MAKKPVNKSTVHVSLPGPLAAAARALATLEGREISDVLAEALRSILRDRGVEPKATADEIEAEVQRAAAPKPKK